ncbi:MAG TPA: hypothetical protein VFL87_03255 [Thermoleophilaceae bacterium]|nr:hypothetical protein [Thermoleophilaceae bacterium]
MAQAPKRRPTRLRRLNGVLAAAVAGEAQRVRSIIHQGEHAGEVLAHRDPFWPAQVTTVAAIALYLALPEKLTLGPRWLLPSLEGLLVIGLVAAMPNPAMQYSPWRRHFALSLTSLVSLANVVSLLLLVHYLLKGGRAGGHQLILSGVVLWVTNVLLFALWFWELDRGGPVTRVLDRTAQPDFLFPQMTDTQWAPEGWTPGFVDYLYVSFTNATAFSPTDTMPLTQRAKLLMTIQALAALLTIGLVVARAVNILA